MKDLKPLFDDCTSAPLYIAGPCSAETEEQVMEMRHLKFQGNKIIRLNTTTGQNEVVDGALAGKNYLETRLYRTDSLISSNLTKGYMGVRRSDTLGVRSAGFASTILYMNAIDEEKGFGYMPIFDTMHIVMTIKDYGGDTLVPIRYKVYELLKPLAENALRVLKGETVAKEY